MIGLAAMVSRLRERVWWPNMSRDAKAIKCRACLLVSQTGPPEPMKRRELPTQPWTDLAIDFMGPLPSGDYLFVMVDYFSRFMLVKIMRSITAPETVKAMRSIFEDIVEGYPQSITMDQGPQFVARDFTNYCESKAITVNHTIPYWPQANGQVERMNRSLLKRLKISQILKRDWKEDLRRYVFVYNTTPHSITGIAPGELHKGRKVRTEIPSVRDIELNERPFTEIRDRDKVAKEKGKEAEDLRRHAKESTIEEGDTVVIKNQVKKDKLTATFRDEDFTVVEKSGPKVLVRSTLDSSTYERNVRDVKKVPEPILGESPKKQASLPVIPSTPMPEARDFNPSVVSTPMIVQNERPKRELKRPAWLNDNQFQM